MSVAMMLSQIQPHFLYNALSCIRRMIKKDPEVAEKAVENFSLYLRQNLESMNRVTPVPFSTELKHVKEYLYLEQLRFGHRLHVEYQIEISDFELPVLTVQPMVENAVKHGVLARPEGGAILISTQQKDEEILISIKDDGVGFDTQALAADDGTHVGISNVRHRIETQCSGKLHILSERGKGTTVTVSIPMRFRKEYQ